MHLQSVNLLPLVAQGLRVASTIDIKEYLICAFRICVSIFSAKNKIERQYTQCNIIQCNSIIRPFKEIVEINTTNTSALELAITLATSLNNLCKNTLDKNANSLWFSL